MTGNEIKALIRSHGVKLWEVAERLGMNDGNFSRRLRKPFDSEETARIQVIVEQLAAARVTAKK